MRRLLIVVASAVALLGSGIAASVALRDTPASPEPRSETDFEYRIDPVTRCGEPPFKPCPTVQGIETLPLEEYNPSRPSKAAVEPDAP